MNCLEINILNYYLLLQRRNLAKCTKFQTDSRRPGRCIKDRSLVDCGIYHLFSGYAPLIVLGVGDTSINKALMFVV